MQVCHLGSLPAEIKNPSGEYRHFVMIMKNVISLRADYDSVLILGSPRNIGRTSLIQDTSWNYLSCYCVIPEFYKKRYAFFSFLPTPFLFSLFIYKAFSPVTPYLFGADTSIPHSALFLDFPPSALPDFIGTIRPSDYSSLVLLLALFDIPPHRIYAEETTGSSQLIQCHCTAWLTSAPVVLHMS